MKLDDVESLLGLYVRKQDWEAALKLAEDPNGTFSEETRAKFDEALYLPYAEWRAAVWQANFKRPSIFGVSRFA